MELETGKTTRQEQHLSELMKSHDVKISPFRIKSRMPLSFSQAIHFMDQIAKQVVKCQDIC